MRFEMLLRLIVAALVVGGCEAGTAGGCTNLRTDSPLVPLLGADGPDVVPDKYIVVFPHSASDDLDDLDDLIAETEKRVTDGELDGELDGPSRVLHSSYRPALDGFAAELSPTALQSLRHDTRIDHISADHWVYATSGAGVNGVQTCPPSWGLDRIDQRDAKWNGVYTYDADGVYDRNSTPEKRVRVYVLDTGIDRDPDLDEPDKPGQSRVICGVCKVLSDCTDPSTKKTPTDCLVDPVPNEKWTDWYDHH